MRPYSFACSVKLQNNIRMVLPPLQSSITGISPALTPAAPAASVSLAPPESFNTNYPDLFAPLKTKAFGYFTLALVLYYALPQYQPFGIRYLSLRFFQLFPALARVKVTIKRCILAFFITLLSIQEIKLDRSLIEDFRSITNGFWLKVDNIVMHYIQSKSTNSAATRLHMFHGFGANGLSYEPIMEIFGKNKLNSVAHDIPGFGFNPRTRVVPEDELFPSIYKPLWNAKASLTLTEDFNSYVTDKTKTENNDKIDNNKGNKISNEDEKNISIEEKKEFEKSRGPIVLMGHSMGSVAAMAAAASVLYSERMLVQKINTKNDAIKSKIEAGNESAIGENIVENVVEKEMRNITLILIDPALTFTKDEQKLPITNPTISTPPNSENKNSENLHLFDPRSLVNLEKVANGVKESGLDLKLKNSHNKIVPVNIEKGFNLKKFIGNSFIGKIFSNLFHFLLSLLAIPLKIILRRIVHWDFFWSFALQKTWGTNPIKVGKNDVFRYKLASMARDFDIDLFKFATAQSAKKMKKTETKNTEKDTDEGDSFPDATVVPSVTQFNLLTSLVDLGCNVVIIHGTSDPIVPYSNSQKMVDLVNRTLHPTVSTEINPKKYVQLLKVPGAGHMPHEENPQKFLEILNEIGYDFL